MKDFLVENGDVVISGNDIQYVRDKELVRQKVSLVLQTNKGEWLLDTDEGINFRAVLVKNPNQDEIISTVREGLQQIDETFEITEYSFETKGRKLVLTFKAVNESGEEISLAVGNVQVTANGRTVDVLICALTAEEILSSGNALDAVSVCDTDTEVIADAL